MKDVCWRAKAHENPPCQRLSLGYVFTLAGVRPVLLVVLGFVLAHNILYTYIAPLPGIGIVGVLIDRHLRALTLACMLLFGLAALLLVRGEIDLGCCI